MRFKMVCSFCCFLLALVTAGCGSSGSHGDDSDPNHLNFSVQLINEATGNPTDAISDGNPGILKITVTFDSGAPATGKLVTATPTKGSFSVSADGTDSTDDNGIAEIKLVAVNEDGESVTGAGEISVQSGEYKMEMPFAFQIGVPDSTRLGAFIDDLFQGGVLASSLAPGETLSYGGTALIVADLVDGDGNPFDQPVTVQFASRCNATLTASVVSENGRAVCVYTSNGCSNTHDVVTATVLKGGTDLTAMVSIPLAQEATGSIEAVSVEPPNIAVAGTATSSKPENALVTFRVKDDKGNVMARELVFFSLTTTEGGITVSPLSRETDENGEVTALVKSGTVATSVRVKALAKDTTISTLSGNISIEETPLSESIGSISLTSGSVIVPADGESQVTLRATVLDKSGTPMPAVDVNFSTTLGTLSATTAWTRSDGIAEVQLRSTSSGTAVITANAHGFLTNLSLNFTPGASMNLSLEPAVTNDGTIETGESIDFRATLRDSRGNPIRGEQINFAFLDGGNNSGASLSRSSGITDDSGTAVVNYAAGDTPGVDWLGATLNSNQSISNTARMEVIRKTVTVGSMVINADPEVIQADGASSSAITVNIKDISGVAVPAGTEVVFSTTMGIFANGGTTLTMETNDDSGALTASLISALIPGDAKVTAVSGGVSQSVTVTFATTIEPVVGTIALTADPTLIPADGTGSTTIDALINDTTGTPIPQGQLVVFTTTLGTFADGSTRYELSTADDTGRIITSLNAGIVPGFAVVTASAGGISQSVVVTLASMDASDVGNILIDADPTVIPANGGSSSTLNITINDTAGNPVVSGHPVYVSTDLGTFANGNTSIELATTDDSGKLVTSLNAGTTPGFALVTVTSGGISQSVVVTISDINAPAVGDVSLTADPTAIPADGASSTTLTAVALDVGGNPVPQGTPIRFATETLGILDPNNLDGDRNARTLILETVDDTGTLAVSLIAGNTPGFTQVTATVGGVSQAVIVTFTDIDAPDVGNIKLTADPETIPADGTSSSTISAVVLSVGGNPVPQGTLFYFSTDLGTFFPDNRDQDNDPQTLTLATVDDSGTLIASLIAGITPGDAKVTVVAGGVSQSTTVSFEGAVIPEVGNITIDAASDTLPADGSSSTAITVTVTDVENMPMPAGTPVTLTTTLGTFPGGIDPDGAGPISSRRIFNISGTNGQINTSLIAPLSQTGTAVITATSGGASQLQEITITVNGNGEVSLVASPTSIIANGSSTATFTATVLDGGGNPVAGVPVVFKNLTGQGLTTVETNTFEGTGITDTSLFTHSGGALTLTMTHTGSSNFWVQLYDNNGNYLDLLKNTTGRITEETTIKQALPAGEYYLSVHADGNWTIKLESELGGTVVTDDFDELPTLLTQATNAVGQAIYTYTSTRVAQVVTIGIKANDVLADTSIEQIAGNAESMSVSASPNPMHPGTDTIVVARIVDANNNPISGESVDFAITVNNSGGSLAATSAVTDLDGQASVIYTAGFTTPVTDRITMTSGGFSEVQDVEVDANAIVVSMVTLTSDENQLPADGSSSTAIRVSVLDTNNTPMPSGTPIILTTTIGTFPNGVDPDGAGPISSRVILNTGDASGQIVTSLIAPLSETGTAVITATSGGVSQRINITIEGSDIEIADSLFLSTSKTSIITDGVDSAIITARVLDVGRVPIEGITVSFAATGGQISTASEVTDENGDAMVVLSSGGDKTNATVTITATVQTDVIATIPIQLSGSTVELNIGTTSLLEPDDGDPDNIIYDKTTLTVIVTDGGGEPVYNAFVDTGEQPVYKAFDAADLSGKKIVLVVTDPDAYDENKDPTGPYTDVNGMLEIMVFAVASSGPEGVDLTVKALEDSEELTLTVDGEPFQIKDPATSSISKDIGTTVNIEVQTPSNNKVKFITTMGSWSHSDPNDIVDESSWEGEKVVTIDPDGDGIVTAVFNTGNTAGVATIRVEELDSESPPNILAFDTLSVAISAPSIDAARLSLQVAPSVIAPSTGGTTNVTTLQATVKNTSNQVVSNAPVMFTLFRTTGGGEAINPPIVYTDSTGQAQSTFASGTLVSDSRGVFCLGRIAGASVAGPDNGFSFVENYYLPDRITRSSGDFEADGFVAGDVITVTNSTSNDGTYTLAGVTADTLTLISGDTLPAEEDDPATLQITAGAVAVSDNVFEFISGVSSGGGGIIRSDNGNFDTDGFDVDDVIRVSGSSSNDGTYTLSSVTGDALGLSDTLIEEGSGASLVIGTAEDTDVVSVVISGDASSVAIGGATVIQSYDESTYKYPMSVLVSDSNGNPVAGAIVNLSLWPTMYYQGTTGVDGPVRNGDGFPNEDLNRNQRLDVGEDSDGNGQIDPAKSTAGSVPATVTTDENGVAQFDYLYLKNYAGWLDVEIRATTLVYGSETSSILEFALGWMEGEKKNIPSSPWGSGTSTP
ncbi:Ig-like domain-containing protein [Desulfocicer vacuolatum]|nr:invasin domain 3-containing protein [Desulfocicer vacuolatum]